MMASAHALSASALAQASTLTISVRVITPTTTPASSQTTTSGVLGFTRISAASDTGESRLTVASRVRAVSRICSTRSMGLILGEALHELLEPGGGALKKNVAIGSKGRHVTRPASRGVRASGRT